MSTDYLTEFLPDLEEFKEKTMQFHQKKLSVAEYKAFSGGFGSYAQRGGDKHMLRLRMAGGRLTKERLRFLTDMCAQYSIDLIKLTTCQSVQLHSLDPEPLCRIMEAAWKAGMISRGGGGDFPRNIMASPLSGVQRGEYFDVMPCAEAAGAYLMGFIKSVRFPRKLKVSFSNGPANDTHATFRDLGFAARSDGTFDVYAAGGLGNQPKPGVLVASGVAPSQILYHIRAMVDTFVTHGNYENRARSRSRFLQDTLGADGLVRAYQTALANACTMEQLDFHPANEVPLKKGGFTAVTDPRVTAQKQDGLYAVHYQPIGGFLPPARAGRLLHAVLGMEAVELRLTPQEGLYVINCTGKEAQEILALTADGAQTRFETSVACIGTPICQVGIGDSQKLLRACVQAVRAEHLADGVLPQIHISGCPSSCGAHQTASIGFRGAVKQTPDGPKPAFAIFLGGCSRQGEEVIADAGKAMLTEDIPRFLAELGRTVSNAGCTYEEWAASHRDALAALVEKYTA